MGLERRGPFTQRGQGVTLLSQFPLLRCRDLWKPHRASEHSPPPSEVLGGHLAAPPSSRPAWGKKAAPAWLAPPCSAAATFLPGAPESAHWTSPLPQLASVSSPEFSAPAQPRGRGRRGTPRTEPPTGISTDAFPGRASPAPSSAGTLSTRMPPSASPPGALAGTDLPSAPPNGVLLSFIFQQDQPAAELAALRFYLNITGPYPETPPARPPACLCWHVSPVFGGLRKYSSCALND